MNTKDLNTLNFLYNRLVEVYKEKPNVDYMKAFKNMIEREASIIKYCPSCRKYTYKIIHSNYEKYGCFNCNCDY